VNPGCTPSTGVCAIPRTSLFTVRHRAGPCRGALALCHAGSRGWHCWHRLLVEAAALLHRRASSCTARSSDMAPADYERQGKAAMRCRVYRTLELGTGGLTAAGGRAGAS